MEGRTTRLHHLFFFVVVAFIGTAQAQSYDYPTANLSTKWINGPNVDHTISYDGDGSTIKALLLRQGPGFYGPSFACGFYCRNSSSTTTPCNSFLFAIFIVYANSGARITLPTVGLPQVVWSANRGRPVAENATLELSEDGDLVLKDADGSLVWSTNTSGKSVVGMNLTEEGNLMLVNRKGKAIWQSFDHPTDTLVTGQKLMEGQKLVANVSATNWTKGELYLSATSSGWEAFVNSTPPQLYDSYDSTSTTSRSDVLSYVTLRNGSVKVFINHSDASTISLTPSSTLQYMRLEFDGHLRVYQWKDSDGWASVEDVLEIYPDNCAYPTVCGKFGVCSNGGQCQCPQNSSGNGNYFKATNSRSPNLGCTLITKLSCQSSQNHRFLVLDDVSYFNYDDVGAKISNLTTKDSCKEACLKDCSCTGAFFQYGQDASHGSCYLPSEIFSLMNNQQDLTHYNSTAFIKVQVSQESSGPNSTTKTASESISTATLVGVIIGSLFGFFIIIGAIVCLIKSRNKVEEDEDEDIFDELPDMPTRFSHEKLKVATNNFLEKLGEGGFGSVFKGTLEDGTIIAVKQLDSINQGKREFLSEVKTIGSVHHVNLARLVGFCVERSRRLLVYEYMRNGSLDKWIFQSDRPQLDWKVKCKIINQVAKGLLYLHEECRQRIIHLDIKPQNILLDENFDAKVSDFGLSKLMDKDESQVMTGLRGTPGYLAPEWLTSIITEKVDVYSFGVVIVEIVCGRKNLDYSQSEGNVHLLGILKDKVEHGLIGDFVREYNHDIEVNEKEFVDMVRLAIWCLQSNTNKRPSMSEVVKVLEGTLKVDPNLDYDFLTMSKNFEQKSIKSNISSPLLTSILSGPR